MTRRPPLTLGAVVTVAVLAVMAAPAYAIPWDMPGVVPPSQTPAADSPDPYCAQSYADDAPRRRPADRVRDRPAARGRGRRGQTTPLVPREQAQARRSAADAEGQAPDDGAAQPPLPGRRRGRDRPVQADGPPLRLARLRRRAPGPLPPARRRRRRHRRLARLRAPGRPRVRPDPSTSSRCRSPTRSTSTFSPNTSDGAYENAVEALARGVPAAKREARRRGYDQLTTGFNYAWRFGDARRGLLAAVGAARRQAAAPGHRLGRRRRLPGDLRPGRVDEPRRRPARGRSPRCASATCRWPASATGRRSTSRSSATRPARAAARRSQATRCARSCARLNRYRGTYGITNFNWFGLRDNNSAGPELPVATSACCATTTRRKPAFAIYRRLIRKLGARQPASRTGTAVFPGPTRRPGGWRPRRGGARAPCGSRGARRARRRRCRR